MDPEEVFTLLERKNKIARDQNQAMADAHLATTDRMIAQRAALQVQQLASNPAFSQGSQQ